MRVIARRTLREFWERHPDAEEPLLAWLRVVHQADWLRSTDVLDTIRTADILPGNRAVFNILGNRYRLVVHIHYDRRVVYVRFVGTHREYDQIDAEAV